MKEYTTQQYKSNVGQEQSIKSDSQSYHFTEKVSLRVTPATKKAIEEIVENNQQVDSQADVVRKALRSIVHVRRRLGLQ